MCELIEGKKPPGIFSLLDDVCATMHSMGTDSSAGGGVDAKFLDKATMFCSENLHFYRKGTGFTVKHYAGDVTYEAEGFTEKVPHLSSLVSSLVSSLCHSAAALSFTHQGASRQPLKERTGAY